MNYSSISDKASIIKGLSAAVDEVNNYVIGLSKQEFEFAPPEKWNAGQQLDHLIRSIKPLNLAFALPLFILKMKFGLTNRPSKTFPGLVEKYERKLIEGGRASGRFVPEPVAYETKEKNCNLYAREKEKLNSKVNRFSEETLDKYILPHPLLGKLTLREMLFFTIHHNSHHLNLMRKYQQ